MINRSLATRIVLTGGVCAWLTASGDAGARIYTTRRHPETQRGSNDLRRLQLSTVAANPGCGQEQREAFVVHVYPISSFTWLLLNQSARDRERSRVMVEFAKWALTDGQKFAPELGYAPLPKEVVALEMQALSRLRV